ncbi:MAG: alkaline phosphatase, partial [Bacteroidetes bacterium]
MKKLTLFLLLSIISVFLVTSCTDMHTHHKAKYVFLFIGDGMGQAQVNLAEAYQAALDNKKGFEHFGFTEFPAVGFASTYAFNNFITGSAASGTALATGHKTNINRISMDPEGKQPFKTIAEKFKESGMKVGILTSVSIDHATPAVFYAHQPKRSMYFEIGNDLVNSSFDFFGGGGFKLPEGEIDGQSINLIEKAKENGFGYVNNVDDFLALNKEAGRVIAVPNPVTESGAMNYV